MTQPRPLLLTWTASTPCVRPWDRKRKTSWGVAVGGRLGTSVASVDIVFDDGGAISDAAPDPPLPFRLTGESEQTWYFDPNLAVQYARVSEQMRPTGKPRKARGPVRLGSKKVVTSKKHAPDPWDLTDSQHRQSRAGGEARSAQMAIRSISGARAGRTHQSTHQPDFRMTRRSAAELPRMA